MRGSGVARAAARPWHVRTHAFCRSEWWLAPTASRLCIAHNDIARRTVILDAIREIKAPFCPRAVVVELSQLLKSYNVYALSGDHFAKEWPVESFRRHGIRYTQDAQPKSDSVLPGPCCRC